MAADCDVLVVGLGPAGASAAITLARSGLRVLALDAARFPRDKLCGDTLNPAATRLLDDLGVRAAVESRALRLAGMQISAPGGRIFTAHYAALTAAPDQPYGLALSRRTLDALLVERAGRLGVAVEEGTRAVGPVMVGERVAGVRVRRNGRVFDIRARLVVAADGRASILARARRLARPAPSPARWATGAYAEGVDGLTDCGEMHVLPRGYIGVAPLPGGIANVCVAGPRDEVARAGGNLERYLLGRVRSEPPLADRFRQARLVSRPHSIGPLAVGARACWAPGLLLAGDAAGFVDPMTGDGLRFAIRGGQLAAGVAAAALESGAVDRRALARLARLRRREFTSKVMMNRLLRRLVATPVLVSLAARGVARRPALAPVLVGVAGDVIPPESVLNPLFLARLLAGV